MDFENLFSDTFEVVGYRALNICSSKFFSQRARSRLGGALLRGALGTARSREK